MRAVDEWIGKTDDAAIPARVLQRVFDAHGGECAKCSRKLFPGRWAMDHTVALVNGGQHREQNLQPLCVSPCHSDKTRTDVREKSTVRRKRAKHIGIKRKSSFPTNRNGLFKKKLDGSVVRR